MPGRAGTTLRAGLAVLALAAPACTSSSKGADPTLPKKPAQTTPAPTTAQADPFAIPDVIDEAYVNRVLAALDQIDGDILRRVVATGGIDPEVPKMLSAIYNEPQYDLELQSLRRLLARGLENFKTPPGNRRTVVTRLGSARRDCIFLEADTDFSQVLKVEPPDLPDDVEIFKLQRRREASRATGLNPTSWAIGNAEVIKRGEEPKERAKCAP